MHLWNLPAYPNPSNLGVWIPYKLASDAKVTISIYNILGRVVRTLDIGRKSAGRHLV
ncbi:MAG TPA: T9SS type A sorting domain-containing protein [Candidatus Latescibacteria bacterium]|nr:T9SS type A sorting domain-containing protein [Candidatus Latescibacterota bacterium]